ncbi:MAG: hypothetical protein ACLR8Y_10170 [Alistipes indistinctus]
MSDYWGYTQLWVDPSQQDANVVIHDTEVSRGNGTNSFYDTYNDPSAPAQYEVTIGRKIPQRYSRTIRTRSLL